MIDLIKRNVFPLLTGLFAFILVFFMNWQVNTFTTSLQRGALGFFIFLLLGFIIEIIISFTNFKVQKDDNSNTSKIDLKTNEENDNIDLNEIYQTEKEESGFKPMQFEKLEVKDEENG